MTFEFGWEREIELVYAVLKKDAPLTDEVLRKLAVQIIKELFGKKDRVQR